MNRMFFVLSAVLIGFLVLGIGVACGGDEEPTPVATATAEEQPTPEAMATVEEEEAGEVEASGETASYRMELGIESAEMMLMPGEAEGATEGEVMVQLPGMPMPKASMTDQGYPVNHHLEVQIFDKASGAIVDKMPMISITDAETGTSRELEDVMAMHPVDADERDIHFGNNVYLPSGTYTVKVTLDGETAEFEDLAVSD